MDRLLRLGALNRIVKHVSKQFDGMDVGKCTDDERE